MFRHCLFVLVSVGLLFTSSALASDGTYKQIRIHVPDEAALHRILSTGIDHEGMTGRVGGFMEFIAGEFEVQELARRGIAHQVVIEDLAAYYKERLSPFPVNALGFGYGSMGGFYTFSEVVQQLDSMRLLFPNLITQRDSIGRTTEGRAIWAVKISDNPGIHEPEEPEVLYSALTHAREPQGMMTAIYYMWWLLQNYGTDATATYLVNNRQMWFIPVVNPDGYVYNQTTNPTGGGSWRKNRRNNGGSFGVDLNRNFGPFYMWDAPNGGSSTTPSSDTYRGPAPFSEPECQALDNFMRAHNIQSAFNYHTYSNLLIYPWGYLSAESKDSLLFRDWGFEMTAVNRYATGTDLQTVAYSTRGNSDDYMYGDTTKPVTYAMTPEVGTTGFWPTTAEIFPLAIENLEQNTILAFAAGQYTSLRTHSVVGTGGGEFVNPGETFALNLTLRNRGTGEALNLNVDVSTSSPFVQFPSPQQFLSQLQPQRDTLVVVSGQVHPDAPTGVPVRLYVTITDPNGYSRKDTLGMYLGMPAVLFTDSATGGTGNWSTGSGWNVTANAHTPPYAFTDSPTGNYTANANNSLTLNNQLNLSGFTFARLKFWTKWAIEATWDFATVEVSTNNGTTWTTLRTRLSQRGSGRSGSRQPLGSWGYDGYTPGLAWLEQHADLTPHVGAQVKLRFRVYADGNQQRDGFYVDDIRVHGYAPSFTAATTPQLDVPSDGATVPMTGVTVQWRPALGAARYILQVATNPTFTSLVLTDSTLTDTLRQTGGLAAGTTYYWRVRAMFDGFTGPVSTVRSFTASTVITRQYQMVDGWNLVSVPLTVDDLSVGSLFPQAVSSAFGFNPLTGYVERDTLLLGSGYWLKFDGQQNVSLTGVPITLDTIGVLTGWNLIGPITDPVSVTSITQIPAGIVQSPYFLYNGTYSSADSLQPSRGYWVKVSESGGLILNSAGNVRPDRDELKRGKTQIRRERGRSADHSRVE